MKLSYSILYVEDIEKTIKFYQDAFNLKHRFTHESGDYAEMETGETTLAFCSHKLADNILNTPYQKTSLETKPLGSQLTFAPIDVKKAYEKAVANGAKSISKPEIKPWNFEVAIVRDCNGHIVELAKNLNL